MHSGFRCGAVDQRPLQVFRFENLAEFLNPPVLDEKLQARLGAQSAIAVVPEEAHHRLPHVGNLIQWDPDADALGEHRVGGQPAADPQIQARAVLGVVHPDESDVIDLVHDILQTADGGLEFAWQIRILRFSDIAAHDLLDCRRGVEYLLKRLTGQR